MPCRTRDAATRLTGVLQTYDQWGQLFFTLREDVILRYEPQYLDSGFCAVRDSYHWRTYYINEDGLQILSAIAEGLSLERLLEACASCAFETALSSHAEQVDSILRFIANFVAKDILRVVATPRCQPDILTPLSLPTVTNTHLVPMRFPTEVDLLLTSGCNLQCKHCLIPQTPTPLPEELTTEEIKQLLLQLDQFGVFMVRLSGGEPMMRPDFLEILQFASELKFGLRLLTNGTLLTEQHLTALSQISKRKNWGLMVNISLDGATAQSHEWLRGVPGCFQRTVETLEHLNEANVRCTVETILHQNNIDEIEDLVQLCITLGVKGLNMHPADSVAKATRHPDTLLSTKDVINLVPVMHDLQQRYGDKVEIEFDMRHHCQFVEPLSGLHLPDNVFTLPRNACQAGMYSMSIGPNGKVYPCNYAIGHDYLEIGDIRKEQLLDIWHSRRWDAFRGGWQLESLSACRECPRHDACPILYCRVYPAITLGDFFGPMPECVKCLPEIRYQLPVDLNLPASLR